MAHRDAAAIDLIGMVPRLRRYARVLTMHAGAADDLVAGTLARARRARHGAPDDDAMAMLAIMRRLHRSRRWHTDASDPVQYEVGGMLRLLGLLPVDEREVLLLVAVERLAYEDVAALLEVPPAAVIARLSRARANLRALTESARR